MIDLLLRILKKYPKYVKILSSIDWVHRLISHFIINKLASSAKPRPRPYSMAAPYTTWRSLTDRTYTGRHLPEADPRPLPPVADVVNLWLREPDREILSFDTSMLFSFFAQWFTDSFLRTNLFDRRRNTSNHEIDLCQIYGLNEEKTIILRSMQEGKLKHQVTDDNVVYPPFLFNVDQTTADNWVFANDDFKKLHEERALRFIFQGVPEDRLKYMFASGLEHGNSSIGQNLLNTIMLREHNRICDVLSEEYPDWDDERLFQTARNVMTVLHLKIVVRDYVGHILPVDFPLRADPGMAEKKPWYRTNWITMEFNLLYRWHSMVPERFVVGDQSYGQDEFRSNTPLVMEYGVGSLITAASRQRTGRIGLKNTPQFFFDPLPIPTPTGPDNRSIMERTVQMGRDTKLRSYNDYRSAFSLDPVNSFEELTDDVELQKELKRLYNNRIDDLEWHVGIFAEKHDEADMLGDLMTRMVAYDAFTHALTNPLLSKYVYNEKTFSPLGVKIIEETNTLGDIVKRNTKKPGRVVATFKTPNEPPGSYGLPLLGLIWDTLDFMLFSGWKPFFTKRREKHGSSVFKVNLFMKTIVILDHDGFEPLFNWDDRLSKDYGFGWAVPPPALVGGIVPSVFQANPNHAQHKSLYMDILKEQAGTFDSTFARVFAGFSEDWVTKGQFGWAEELERLCVAFVFEWYFGARPAVDKVRFLYSNIFAHIPLALLKLLPWSAYNRSKPLFRDLLQFVKTSDGFKRHANLGRAQGLKDEEALAKQLLFLTGMNNFLGLQGMSKAIVGELTNRPELVDELRAEIVEAEKAAGGQLDLASLNRLGKLDRTLKEVMRLHPPVFFIFGRAAKDFHLHSKSGTFAINTGDHLMGVIPFAHLDPDAYEDPKTFDPDRFKSPEATDHLIWPHGQHDADISADGHICPGKDVALLFGKVLCRALVTGFDWSLAIAPRWSDTKYALNVASPVGAMNVTRFERRGAT